MTTFRYGQKEIDYLTNRDPVLGEAIKRIGMIERETHPDLFSALVRNIVSQQVAKKAAATVWGRVQNLLGEVTPPAVDKADPDAMQKCGLTMRKVNYIKNAAEALITGRIDFDSFPNMTDNEVIKVLTTLPGIGVWTAEMLLIFSMQRPDVLSWGDLALKRGMKNLYGIQELTKDTFESYRKLYSPCGSVAALYLWELS